MSSASDPSTQHLPATETLRGYDRWAQTYDRVDNPAVASSSWILDRAPLDCRDQDVVELGCGTGRNALRVLAEGARSYTGVDGSRGMLAVASERVPDPRAHWIEADLVASWTSPRTYDLALVVLVLEHLPRLDVLASSLASAVRPGGRIRIVDLHHDVIDAGAIAQFDDGGANVRFTSVAHPVDAVRDALDAAGFDVELRIHLVTDEMATAIPKLAKYRGRPHDIDITGVRVLRRDIARR
jgi:SAM-dependent methyltransferase